MFNLCSSHTQKRSLEEKEQQFNFEITLQIIYGTKIYTNAHRVRVRSSCLSLN